MCSRGCTVIWECNMLYIRKILSTFYTERCWLCGRNRSMYVGYEVMYVRDLNRNQNTAWLSVVCVPAWGVCVRVHAWVCDCEEVAVAGLLDEGVAMDISTAVTCLNMRRTCWHCVIAWIQLRQWTLSPAPLATVVLRTFSFFSSLWVCVWVGGGGGGGVANEGKQDKSFKAEYLQHCYRLLWLFCSRYRRVN